MPKIAAAVGTIVISAFAGLVLVASNFRRSKKRPPYLYGNQY
jgi:hypothetical protein